MVKREKRKTKISKNIERTLLRNQKTNNDNIKTDTESSF